MISVPANLINDLNVILEVLHEGNATHALELLSFLLEMLEAEAD